MLIVDSQIHVWGADRPDRPWPTAGTGGRNPIPNRAVPLGYEEVVQEMDSAGVDAAVLIPPSWEGDYNDMVLDAVVAHPTRFAVMGRISPDATDGPSRIARWKEQPGMYGIRVLLEPGSAWPLAGIDHWLWPAAESASVSVTVATRSHVDLIEQLADRFPRLRLSIDHLGTDWAKTDRPAFASLSEVLKLARHPNVGVKASMLPALSSEPYPYRNIHDHAHAAFDAFGPKRFFWGSNLSRLSCSYRQAVTLFTEELPWLSGQDLEWVMGRALCEWIKWRPANAKVAPNGN
jgi:L-fuconolactonase